MHTIFRSHFLYYKNLTNNILNFNILKVFHIYTIINTAQKIFLLKKEIQYFCWAFVHCEDLFVNHLPVKSLCCWGVWESWWITPISQAWVYTVKYVYPFVDRLAWNVRYKYRKIKRSFQSTGEFLTDDWDDQQLCMLIRSSEIWNPWIFIYKIPSICSFHVNGHKTWLVIILLSL